MNVVCCQLIIKHPFILTQFSYLYKTTNLGFNFPQKKNQTKEAKF